MSNQGRKNSGISRVIKQGTHFICGLCGTRYTQNAAAEACLRNCATKLNPEGVAAASAGDQKQSYRCTYCKRTYDSFDDAKTCAKTCHAKMQKKIETENKAKTVQVSEAKLRALSQLAGESVQNLLPSTPQRKDPKPREEPTSRSDETLARKKAAPAAPTAQATREKVSRTSPPMESKPEPTKSMKASSETQLSTQEEAPTAEGEGTVYLREASKFRCLRCRKLHPSRKDVYSCFESHDTQQQDSFDISLDPTPELAEATPRTTRPPKNLEEEATPELVAKDPNRVRAVAVKSETDKYFRDGARYGCRACKKKYFTKPEVIACFDSHGDDVLDEISTPTSSPAPTPPTKKPVSTPPANSRPTAATKETATPPAKPAGEKISNEQLVDAILESAMREVRPPTPASKDGGKESDEKFYRNGAKYVCKKCGAKYFTKEDVISCFDRHS